MSHAKAAKHGVRVAVVRSVKEALEVVTVWKRAGFVKAMGKVAP